MAVQKEEQMPVEEIRKKALEAINKSDSWVLLARTGDQREPFKIYENIMDKISKNDIINFIHILDATAARYWSHVYWADINEGKKGETTEVPGESKAGV